MNPDQYNGDVGFWRRVDEAEIVRRRVQIVNWLDARLGRGESVMAVEGQTGEGRGIVMTGGNQVRGVTRWAEGLRAESELMVGIGHDVQADLGAEVSETTQGGSSDRGIPLRGRAARRESEAGDRVFGREDHRGGLHEGYTRHVSPPFLTDPRCKECRRVTERGR